MDGESTARQRTAFSKAACALSVVRLCVHRAASSAACVWGGEGHQQHTQHHPAGGRKRSARSGRRRKHASASSCMRPCACARVHRVCGCICGCVVVFEGVCARLSGSCCSCPRVSPAPHGCGRACTPRARRSRTSPHTCTCACAPRMRRTTRTTGWACASRTRRSACATSSSCARARRWTRPAATRSPPTSWRA